MGAISPWHLLLVLGIALIVLGPGKLPETGAAIGKAIRSFQDAVNGRDDAVSTKPSATTAAPSPLAPASPASPAAPPQSAQPPERPVD
jgi:sec-independent protein translocase protein TatA